MVCTGETPAEALPDDELLLLNKDKVQEETQGQWTLWVTTGEQEGQNTRADVLVEVNRYVIPSHMYAS